MSSTDHPVPGPDEAGGEPDPAGVGSRARVARLGWVLWAVGAALAVTQVVVMVVAPRDWRGVGAAMVVLVTLAGVGFAVFGGDG